MADPVVTNVEHTGAILWVSDVDTALPDETTVDYGDAWPSGWARVGFTKAPLALAYTSEEADIEVEEHLAPIKRRRIREGITWETVLAELTADYIQLAASNQDTPSEVAAGGSQDGYESVGMGDVSLLTEKQWGIEMLHIEAGGNLQPIRFFMWKGTAMVNGNLEFSKKTTEYPGIPIQIKGLVQPTKNSGQRLMLFHRITAEKTS